jgi:hypothetical protein
MPKSPPAAASLLGAIAMLESEANSSKKTNVKQLFWLPFSRLLTALMHLPLIEHSKTHRFHLTKSGKNHTQSCMSIGNLLNHSHLPLTCASSLIILFKEMKRL